MSLQLPCFLQYSKYFVGICHDISEQQAALRDRKHAQEALAAKDWELGKEPSNSSIPKICIRTLVQEDECIIRIADNGSGMTDKVRNHIFDPFFTTKPVGKGTGMGLSVCYQIVVKNHRGQLHCISAPGAGAEFIITIPIQ